MTIPCLKMTGNESWLAQNSLIAMAQHDHAQCRVRFFYYNDELKEWQRRSQSQIEAKMIKVTLIEHDGTEHNVDSEAGQNLMELAIANNVPGIDADCGGAGACGTCHVMVAEQWRDKAGEPDDLETSMLDMRPDYEEGQGSRLACQIVLADSLNGLTVQLPEFQM